MLPANRWKPDAIMRFLLSVFLCMYAGFVLGSIWSYGHSPAVASPALFYSVAGLALGLTAATGWLIARPWQVEGLLKQVGIVLGLFYGAMAAGAWAQKLAGPAPSTVGQLSIGALCFEGGVLLMTTRFLREHGSSWAEAFGFRNRLSRALLAGLVVALLFMPVGWGLQQTSAFVVTHVPSFGIKPEEQQAVQVLRTTVSLGDRLKMGLVTILLAPWAEEILFRGILYAWLQQVGFPRIALWGTAIVFALVHFNLVTFLPLLVLSLILALLYERTRNLLAPIAAHSLFNALNFALLLLTRSPGS